MKTGCHMRLGESEQARVSLSIQPSGAVKTNNNRRHKNVTQTMPPMRLYHQQCLTSNKWKLGENKNQHHSGMTFDGHYGSLSLMKFAKFPQTKG